VSSISINDPTTGNNHWTVVLEEHVEDLIGLGFCCSGFRHRQWFVSVNIEVDFSQLYIQRQMYQDRHGAGGAHELKCFLESSRRLPGFQHSGRHLAQWLCNFVDIDGLKIFFMYDGHWRLSGDAT